MKYSFLLPVFKATYLESALKSIKDQNFHDFKVLVSDDCSPEDLKAIFDRVVGDDERFSYRRNEENMGGRSLASHWNLLLDMCDTEYFIMASDDDLYEPNFLEQVDVLTDKYPEVDLVRGRCRIIDGDGHVTKEDTPRKEFESQIEFQYNLNFTVHCKCLPNCVFKTKEMRAQNGFVDYPLGWGSDDVAVAVSCRNGVALTPDIVFSFRYSGINYTTINDRETVMRKFEAMKQLYCFNDNYFASLEACNTLDENRLAALRYNLTAYALSYFTDYVGVLPYKGFKSTYRFMKEHGIISSFTSRFDFISTWLKSSLTRKA